MRCLNAHCGWIGMKRQTQYIARHFLGTENKGLKLRVKGLQLTRGAGRQRYLCHVL